MNEKITFVAYENHHHHQSNPKTETETENQRLIEKNQPHSMDNTDNNNEEAVEVNNNRRSEMGKAMIAFVCGSLVYYHCAYRNSSLLSLLSDFLIVLLCSLAMLGLLFLQLSISVPVDPLEWQISQDTANTIIASFANTVGAAESVLRVAATGHDKRLFFKVVGFLYLLSVLGRFISGVTVAYTALWLFCLYMLADNTQSGSTVISWILGRNNGGSADSDVI